MNPYQYGNKFGYAEMYEWNKIPEITRLGRLVQFSKENPEKVEIAKDTKNIVGISGISPAFSASDPKVWPYKYLFNEYEDLYLKKEIIAVSQKEYDQLNEFSYISTKPKDILLPIENEEYDKGKEYIKRSNRIEWIPVILLGKAVIEDNGKCKPGKYCTLYVGDDELRHGSVIPAKKTDKFKLYVLSRLSDKTIVVFFTPQIYFDI